jgi:hypothetical protein
MKHQRHFEATGAPRKVAQTKALIAELGCIVEKLEIGIAAEEARAGISDCSRPEYPVLARALSARRDNLRTTIAALDQHVGVAGAVVSLRHVSGREI